MSNKNNAFIIDEFKLIKKTLLRLKDYEAIKSSMDLFDFELLIVRACEVIGGSIKNLARIGIVEFDNDFWKSWIYLRDKVSHIYTGINLDYIEKASRECEQAIKELDKLVAKYSDF